MFYVFFFVFYRSFAIHFYFLNWVRELSDLPPSTPILDYATVGAPMTVTGLFSPETSRRLDYSPQLGRFDHKSRRLQDNSPSGRPARMTTRPTH